MLPSLVLALAATVAPALEVAPAVEESVAAAVEKTAAAEVEEIEVGSVTSVEDADDVAVESALDQEVGFDGDLALDLDFDFDLLDAPEPAAPLVDSALLTRRRLMLSGHQAFGLALVAAMAGTMITGQLNYWDGHMGDETGRFELSHRVLSYSTFGLFAVTAGGALLAPVPDDRVSSGFDRVMLHRIGLFSAAAGMVAQAILGPVTASRQGFLDQEPLAVAHLAVGWTTLALMAVGVGALVF